MIKFLVIRFSSIGDIVLTTPVIRNLKKQVEGAEIHFLTKKQYASLADSNPNIDEVHILGENFKETINNLKYLHFDYIIDLHHNLRTQRIKNALKLPAFSFNKLNKEKWLLVNFGINKLPEKHIVDRYMETLNVFDVEDDKNGLDFFIPANDEVDLKSLPENFRSGYVGLVIGAQHATKKLPKEKLLELAQNLNKPIIVLGGKEDAELGEQIAVVNASRIINACGKYNLNQSASLVKQANVIITHDTGLMHMAAAFRKKIISVWGNTIPEFGMTPYLANEQSRIFEVSNLKCRPCSKIGFRTCPKKHFKCMLEQNIAEIVHYAEKIFEE